MEDFWTQVEHFFYDSYFFVKNHATEFFGLIMGAFGSKYMSTTTGVELTSKQKVVRFISGGVLGVTIPSLISYLTGTTLNVFAASAISYLSGYVGLEGITRIIVNNINSKKKSHEKD